MGRERQIIGECDTKVRITYWLLIVVPVHILCRNVETCPNLFSLTECNLEGLNCMSHMVAHVSRVSKSFWRMMWSLTLMLCHLWRLVGIYQSRIRWSRLAVFLWHHNAEVWPGIYDATLHRTPWKNLVPVSQYQLVCCGHGTVFSQVRQLRLTVTAFELFSVCVI